MGADLCRGIYALQKHEICIGDLSPARCLLDGPGVLKINNLSCAHFENEEIESVYQSGSDRNIIHNIFIQSVYNPIYTGKGP